MKTFEEFRDEIDQISEIDLGTRKSSPKKTQDHWKEKPTKFKKEKRTFISRCCLEKGMKSNCKTICYAKPGKGKDLADLSLTSQKRKT